MVINFQGINRTVTSERKTENGFRIMTLSGPKVDYYAVEKVRYPGQFIVINSRQKVIGGLIERDGKFVETN